ncbi:Predicted 5' DNA nuclease, flap endonuclease-1-like, helix-3-turn-helix (H3TH) domain [Arboricoccus pini]|uniref:Predicted 5' DNA nuclease, flap endonuclease-1-like, helix-3-turn-helix (H3TH) domain n=1 Tax=Arboricoccus pini TaxID=1963835 RepID=A0A212R2Z6_9PROT|nr:hypothetical protein [Arboricoccus pini]SNB66383.1 Predicted 5' DNA nuclease, flap endonuclease-1-like, helix-3-turn-helix (H3TH) domain [Arboricoccus pini]
MDLWSLSIGFLLGVVVAIVIAWVAVSRASERRLVAIEKDAQDQIQRAMQEARDADLAHRETKERLIALELARAAVPVAQPAADKAPSLANSNRDRPSYSRPAANNLKRIRGIGRAVEKRLNGMGITTISALAELGPDQIKSIEERLGFPGRVEREAWIVQARALSEADARDRA